MKGETQFGFSYDDKLRNIRGMDILQFKETLK
jgi:hypothetical protein